MGKIIIPIQKYEEKVEEIPVDEVKTEEKTLLDIAEEPAIKLAPAVPGAPNNMIQKHVDNFLAKIAGETPVDDEVRDSTEYWLNKIAESGGGGTTVIPNPETTGTETKLNSVQIGSDKYLVGEKIYRHTLVLRVPGLGFGVDVSFILYNNDSNQFTKSTLYAYLKKVYPMIEATYPDIRALHFSVNAVYGNATHIVTGHFYAPTNANNDIYCYLADYAIGATSATSINQTVTTLSDTVTEL